jgi:hypothetical protein
MLVTPASVTTAKPNGHGASPASLRSAPPKSGSTIACNRARRAGVTVHRRRLTRPWLGPSPTRNEPALAEPAIIKQENPGSECDHDLLPLGAARSICGRSHPDRRDDPAFARKEKGRALRVL